MGGLSLVIGELSNSDSGIRTTSAWIVGKASQNNPLVQNQVLELGALPKLMMMVKSGIIEEATKALYAVSAVIRNNQNGVESFYSEGGESMFQGILSNATADVRLQRRSVSLIADLAEYQLEYNSKLELPFLSNCALVRPVIDLTASDDLDLQEKVVFRVFHVQCLHIPVWDRTPLAGLIKIVEEKVMIEHTLSPNKPIYLIGESFGGALALAVSARNPTLDLILVVGNPATSYERSPVHPLVAFMRTLPDEYYWTFPYLTSFLLCDVVKMASVKFDDSPPPFELLSNIIKDLPLFSVTTTFYA